MPAISRSWGVRNRDECRDPFFTQSLLDVFANDGMIRSPLNKSNGSARNSPRVSYCDRYRRLEARFAGLNCTADEDGVVTCTDPETLRLLLKTLDANHFNFLHANAAGHPDG